MTEGIVDLGEIVLPDWDVEHPDDQRRRAEAIILKAGASKIEAKRKANFEMDLSRVRGEVFAMRRGEADANGYRVSIVWPDGERDVWGFANEVGYPVSKSRGYLNSTYYYPELGIPPRPNVTSETPEWMPEFF